MSILRVGFALELEDLKLEQLDLQLRPVVWRAGIAVAATVITVGVILLATLSPFAAVLGTAAVVGVTARLFWMSTRVAELEPPPERILEAWRKSYLDVSEDSIEFGNPISRTRLAWDGVHHWSETERGFLLYSSQSQCVIFPKRVLGSPEAEEKLREQFAAHVEPGGEASIESNSSSEWIRTALYYSVLALLIGSAFEGVWRILSGRP